MEAKQLRHSAEEIANRLEKSQKTKGGWLACCPAHPDKSPSLSIKDGDKGWLSFTASQAARMRQSRRH